MESKYKYYGNDLDSFDIFHEEGEARTPIATTDTAEKADFLVKAANYFISHDYGEFDSSKTLDALHRCFGVMMQFNLVSDSIESGVDAKRESIFSVNVSAKVIIDARKEAERLYYEATKAADRTEVKAIEDLNDINYNSNEGVLLFAALILLTLEKGKSARGIIKLLDYVASTYDRWQDLNRNKAVLIKRDATTSDNEVVTLWRFVLKAGNGEIIAQGEYYNQKQSAIETLERNFPNFKIVEITDLSDKEGPF